MTLNFNYVGPINTTGYGVASLGYLSALSNVDKVPFKPIGNADLSTISDMVVDPDLEKPVFCFWHLFDLLNQIKEFKGKKVGLTTFELNTLTTQEVAAINSLDVVCAASTWGVNILRKYTKKPVHCVPHAFAQIITTLAEPKEKTEDYNEVWSKFLDPISFPSNSLFLSTAGKYESRKAHPELIDACIELSSEQPVVLVSFLYNPFIPDNFPYSFINSRFFYPVFTKNGVKVFKKNNFYLVLMPPTKSRQDLHRYCYKTDFFVSPSKGEGWNLPLFEMMSMGMPCISTLVTAHTDYCNQTNIIDVEVDQSNPFVIADDNLFFRGQGSWYNITKDSILKSLKKANIVKTDERYMKALSFNAINKTKEFTWERSANKIISIMKQY